MTALSTKYSLLAVCLLLIAIAALFMISLPGSVTVPGLAVPLCEWSISQPESDKIVTSLANNLAGTREHMTIFQYNRPDYVGFTFASQFTSGQSVEKQEKIAELESYDDKLRFSRLVSDLNGVKRQIRFLMTGEKPSVKEEAENALQYARRQRESFLPQLERRRQLFAQELITREELEVAESTYELYEINERLRQASLTAIETGAKPEEIEIARSQLEGLDQQLRIISEKLTAQSFFAPISGIIVESQNPADLFKMVRTDTMVLVLPLPADCRVGLDQEFTFTAGDISGSGRISAINPEIQVLNGRPFLVAKGLVANEEYRLKPQQQIMAHIDAGPLGLSALIRRQWQTFTRRFQDN